jgi:hypothetical protein
MIKLWLFAPDEESSDSVREFYSHVGDLIREARERIIVCIAWMTRKEILKPLLERVEDAVKRSCERAQWEEKPTNYKVRDEMIECLRAPSITIWFNAQDLGRPDRYPSPEIDRILELAVSYVGAFECAIMGEYGYRGTNMHLKLVCVDDNVILGSMNFSYFSDNNYEMMIELRSDELATTIAEEIDRRTAEHALVKRKDWKKIAWSTYYPDDPPTANGFWCFWCSEFKRWNEWAKIIEERYGIWGFVCRDCVRKREREEEEWLKKNWNSLLLRVREYDMELLSLMVGGRVVSLREDKLTFSVPSEFGREYVEREKHRKFLRKMLREVLGREVQIRVVVERHGEWPRELR